MGRLGGVLGLGWACAALGTAGMGCGEDPRLVSRAPPAECAEAACPGPVELWDGAPRLFGVYPFDSEGALTFQAPASGTPTPLALEVERGYLSATLVRDERGMRVSLDQLTVRFKDVPLPDETGVDGLVMRNVQLRLPRAIEVSLQGWADQALALGEAAVPVEITAAATDASTVEPPYFQEVTEGVRLLLSVSGGEQGPAEIHLKLTHAGRVWGVGELLSAQNLSLQLHAVEGGRDYAQAVQAMWR